MNKEVIEKLAMLLTAAFGLVAALAWNGAIQAIFKEVFDKVEITYEMGEPETVEKDGMVMIVQNEKSIVQITDEQLQQIIDISEEVRNQLIAH